MYKLMAKFVRTRKEGYTPAKMAFLVVAFGFFSGCFLSCLYTLLSFFFGFSTN